MSYKKRHQVPQCLSYYLSHTAHSTIIVLQVFNPASRIAIWLACFKQGITWIYKIIFWPPKSRNCHFLIFLLIIKSHKTAALLSPSMRVFHPIKNSAKAEFFINHSYFLHPIVFRLKIAIRIASNTSRLPIDPTPVDIIQRRADHPLTGGGMNKLIVGIVNAHMQAVLSAAGFEKYQITG